MDKNEALDRIVEIARGAEGFSEEDRHAVAIVAANLVAFLSKDNAASALDNDLDNNER